MSGFIDKNLHIFVNSQFPAHFRRDGEMLVKFIEYYYKWLEEEDNTTDVSRKLYTYRDSDVTEDKFFEFLRNEFMQSLPKELMVDERLLIKKITDFYKSKGSEDSYRLLFRILYNTEIDFYYPGEDILRASDGRWTRDIYIIINPVTDPSTYGSISLLQGSVSGAKAKYISYEETPGDVLAISNGDVLLTSTMGDVLQVDEHTSIKKMTINNVFGDFVMGENLIDVSTGTVVANTVMNGVIYAPGRWIGTKGFLSWDKYLQDNFYYQEYSYVIKSNHQVAEYRDTVKATIHPSGTLMFGQIQEEYHLTQFDKNNISINISYDGNEENVTPIVIVVDSTHLNVVTSSFDVFNIFNLSQFEDFAVELEVAVPDITPQGTVSLTTSTTLSTYGSETLGMLGPIPLSEIGSGRLLRSTVDNLTTLVTDGDVIAIDDTDNSIMSLNIVTTVYNDRYMRIRDTYPSASFDDEDYYINYDPS